MAAGVQHRKRSEKRQAIEQFEAAVQLAETFDPRGLDLGRALFHLASAHLFERAAELPLTRALAILEENLPADHPEVIAALEEAEKLLRRLLDLESGGANAKLQAAHRLAAVLRKMGRADEADRLVDDALTGLYRELRGD